MFLVFSKVRFLIIEKAQQKFAAFSLELVILNVWNTIKFYNFQHLQQNETCTECVIDQQKPLQHALNKIALYFGVEDLKLDDSWVFLMEIIFLNFFSYLLTCNFAECKLTSVLDVLEGHVLGSATDYIHPQFIKMNSQM